MFKSVELWIMFETNAVYTNCLKVLFYRTVIILYRVFKIYPLSVLYNTKRGHSELIKMIKIESWWKLLALCNTPDDLFPCVLNKEKNKLGITISLSALWMTKKKLFCHRFLDLYRIYSTRWELYYKWCIVYHQNYIEQQNRQ